MRGSLGSTCAVGYALSAARLIAAVTHFRLCLNRHAALYGVTDWKPTTRRSLLRWRHGGFTTASGHHTSQHRNG